MDSDSAGGSVMANRDENAELRRELQSARREAEELARVARLVSETLDLATVGERITEVVLALLRVHSSAIRLVRADGALAPLALGGEARHQPWTADVIPLGVGMIGRVALEGRPLW